MAEVLTADDLIYEELYDVRREAEDSGNFVEGDMNPGMNALRDKAPVQKGFLRERLGLPQFHRHSAAAGREGYTSFTFRACETAFRDHERFSSHILKRANADGENQLGILEMDEPDHRAYRRTLQSMFIKPRALTWWRDRWIDEIVDTLVDKLKRQDRAELNLQLCARIPVHTITRAVGFDGEEALLFRHALLRSGAHGRISLEDQRAAAATVDEMVGSLIAKRRKEPGDDVTSGLLRAELELNGERRALSDREIAVHIKLVMLAGGGTSWRQMGITLWALLTHRDQLEAVKSDRKLLDAAIEEAVRWNPTDPVFSRLITCDTELEGVAMHAGAVLDICLGAANRDPSRWDNPDAYDLHRPMKPHLGFGVGTHQCLGMNVGKAEINAAINALLNAFPDLRLDPDAPAPHLTGGLEQRGISGLPVILR